MSQLTAVCVRSLRLEYLAQERNEEGHLEVSRGLKGGGILGDGDALNRPARHAQIDVEDHSQNWPPAMMPDLPQIKPGPPVSSTTELVVLVGDACIDERRIGQLLRRHAVIILAPSLESIRKWLPRVLAQEQRHRRHSVVTVSHLRIDLTERRARWIDQELHLTERELEILALLADDPGRAWSFGELAGAAWDGGYVGDSEAVRSVIKRLRKKLATSAGSLVIESVRGVGFRLNAKPNEPVALRRSS